jgi:hypothetical protein
VALFADPVSVSSHVRARIPRSWTPTKSIQSATSGRLGRSGQYLDVPVRSVHADPLAVADQAGGVLHADDGGEAVLQRDHGAVVVADVAAQQGAALHATGP